MRSKPRSLSLLDLYRVFLGLAVLEGFLALWSLFRIPSESHNASLFNYSLQRVGIGFAILLLLVILIFFLYDSLGPKKLLKFLTAKIDTILAVDVSHVILKTSFVIILVSSLASLLFYLFPDLQRLIFFLPNNYIFEVLGERAGFLIGWMFLISLKILTLYFVSGRRAGAGLAIPVRLMVIAWIMEGFVFILFVLWSLISRKWSPPTKPRARTW